MHPDRIFQLANGLALLSWLFLIFRYNRPIGYKVVIGVGVALLCLTYALLITIALQVDDFSKFSTLDGVMELMNSKHAALIGWLHYLAFDLMVGVFIAANGTHHGIPFVALLPCFFLCFMLGPVGLLIYLVIRWAYTKHYFAHNYS